MSQGWSINATDDTITFLEAPPAGTNNIVVREYATASINATSIWKLGAWNPEYGYPREVEFFAERLVFAATEAQPQTMWLSRIDDYSMFGKSTPITDDDAITATCSARTRNRIGDLLPKTHLLAMTYGGVFRAGPGDDAPLTPSTMSTKLQPSAGSSSLPALDVGETAIYCTYKGGEVRDLSYAFEADGYAGSDLTAFASHLLEQRTITDWAWQAVPYSSVVAVRDDGILLTLTYKREHQVVAWARHTTEGRVESVCTVPEPGGHAVYVIVARTVNGQTQRYVERFADPAGEDWREHVGVDSALTYDGRSRPGTLTLTGGATADAVVTITASTASFASSNVGDAVVIGYDDAVAVPPVQPYEVVITEYVSATVVKGLGNRPRTLGAATDWALAVDTVSGLGHLEGCTVRIASDGYDGGLRVVSAGKVTLDRPGVLVHVGLPYSCDFESLDLNLIGAESINTRAKLVREVGVLTRNTRIIEVGPNFDVMETRQRSTSVPLGVPPELMDGWETWNVHDEWTLRARVCIRCTDPYGATVLALEPAFEVGR